MVYIKKKKKKKENIAKKKKAAQVWALRTLGSDPASALHSHLICLSRNSLTRQTRIITPALVTPIRVVVSQMRECAQKALWHKKSWL